VTRSPAPGVLSTMGAMPLAIPAASNVGTDARGGAWAEAGPWRELFSRIAAGEVEALARLYDLAADRLFGLALWRTGSRDDAADVVQETFVRVAEQRARLDRVRDPRWWLLAVAHRLAIDHARRRQQRPAEGLEACAELVAPQADQALAVDAARVCELLWRLPAKQRAVIYLRHFGEMTFAEIGNSLGIPLFTAASRYRLALARLRQLVGGAT